MSTLVAPLSPPSRHARPVQYPRRHSSSASTHSSGPLSPSSRSTTAIHSSSSTHGHGNSTGSGSRRLGTRPRTRRDSAFTSAIPFASSHITTETVPASSSSKSAPSPASTMAMAMTATSLPKSTTPTSSRVLRSAQKQAPASSPRRPRDAWTKKDKGEEEEEEERWVDSLLTPPTKSRVHSRNQSHSNSQANAHAQNTRSSSPATSLSQSGSPAHPQTRSTSRRQKSESGQPHGGLTESSLNAGSQQAKQPQFHGSNISNSIPTSGASATPTAIPSQTSSQALKSQSPGTSQNHNADKSESELPLSSSPSLRQGQNSKSQAHSPEQLASRPRANPRTPAVPPSILAAQEIPRQSPLISVPASTPATSVQWTPYYRPMYNFNASNPEEEAQRAHLASVCEGLSSLCSQWHGSEYNRLKHGPNGSPQRYCPLTIVAPQHVAKVMEAQEAYEADIYADSDESDPMEEDEISLSSDEGSRCPATPGSSWLWESKPRVVDPEGPRPFDREEGLDGATLMLNLRSDDNIAKGVADAMNQPIGPPPKTSQSHPINISFFLPLTLLPVLPEIVPNATPSTRPLMYRCNHDLFERITSEPGPSVAHPLLSLGRIESYGVGNLFLSSCPGKKVRLDGPVKGRGAICRDLKSDLERIHGLGVGCIVCCLDDNELSYLGAPWDEYHDTARKVGLAVVRIPMPEGLTPASLEAFDKRLEKVLLKYTLKGVHVLTHCRGGVGRAGLTACAWAVKLGLIGPDPTLCLQALSPKDQEHCRVMSTVERVIYLIRRRRSVKAIETYEQVNFLVAYVAWLRQASSRHMYETMDSQ